MNALEALTTRASAVGILADPAPDDAALETMLKAAQRAPDHGHLRPWRFFIIRGEARETFANVLVSALRIRDPGCTEAMLKKEQAKSLRAPLIIVVGAKIADAAGIPAQEQVLAAGAAAQNILTAAYALGYGAVWKTGQPAYDPNVKAALGMAPTDEIVGFLYIGSQKDPRSPPEEAAQNVVLEWTTSLSN